MVVFRIQTDNGSLLGERIVAAVSSEPATPGIATFVGTHPEIKLDTTNGGNKKTTSSRALPLSTRHAF
jgi:hypothetical protein